MKYDDLELTLVPRGTREWDYLWNALANHKANRNLSQPTVAENFGEAWEYMETQRETSWFGLRERYFHCFRHRMHPTLGPIRKIKIPASKEFQASTDLVVTWSLKSTS